MQEIPSRRANQREATPTPDHGRSYGQRAADWLLSANEALRGMGRLLRAALAPVPAWQVVMQRFCEWKDPDCTHRAERPGIPLR